MRFFIATIVFFICLGAASAQDTTKVHPDSLPNKFYLLENVERYGETMPEIEIDEVTVKRKAGLGKRFKWWRYRRLVYNVKKVYPYAILVRESMADVSDTLSTMSNERIRRSFLRKYEKSIFKEYEDDMRQMTITQGKILIKLIDRETQNTGFELIKDHRGSVPAVFWQGIARIFGTNLKAEYDAEGDDYLIEKVIYEIEHGRL
ncbi:MAG: DUF4294 domain-containing protein [Bacteroidales bacterium]|nr:DUF4294 domain-containing protein [Bacteroidales bacterium]